ncbi:MAG: GGDEF domain-containing protein, partial [Gammaproteobacteria bacterium]|nr:GGDEF domain-containing protein [Gammaproteobacteria bacterium]
RMQIENSDLTRELHHRATHDSLVDLVNQGEFKRRLQRLTNATQQDKSDYSLIFIDLDLFKDVNDTGGHAAGDRVLQGVAEIIRCNTRTGDTAARVGGDEFAAILYGCPHDRAMEIAERIRTQIENFQVAHDGRYYSVRASIGVAYGKTGEHTATSMLKAADAACYAAKEEGRNRVREKAVGGVFDSSDRFELTQALSAQGSPS